jgi:hypothetical protein
MLAAFVIGFFSTAGCASSAVPHKRQQINAQRPMLAKNVSGECVVMGMGVTIPA